MTQYTKKVEDAKLREAAEEWAKGVVTIHGHSLSSMYYDTRPEDTADGKCVTDVEFNSGIVERYSDDKLIHTFGEKLTGQDLVDQYQRLT